MGAVKQERERSIEKSSQRDSCVGIDGVVLHLTTTPVEDKAPVIVLLSIHFPLT
jgi:hypothetical protein